MVRPTDRKTTAIEKILIVIFKIQNSRGGGKPWRGGQTGKHQCQEAEEEGTLYKSLHCGFLDRNGQGKASRLRIGWLELFQWTLE